MANTGTEQTPPDDVGVISLADACRRLDIGTSTGYHLAKAGLFPIPIVTIGKSRKVLKVDIERFLAGVDRDRQTG